MILPMKTIEIVGKHYCGTAVHTRIACRGVVLRGDAILLSHELNTGWYLIPGGGLEGEESPEECCIREIQEETGYLVRPLEQYLTLKEYYGEWCYISHYFLCEELGRTEARLTELEAQRGLIPRWVTLEEARAIFSEYVHMSHHEEKRGSYQREALALKVFREEVR